MVEGQALTRMACDIISNDIQSASTGERRIIRENPEACAEALLGELENARPEFRMRVARSALRHAITKALNGAPTGPRMTPEMARAGMREDLMEIAAMGTSPEAGRVDATQLAHGIRRGIHETKAYVARAISWEAGEGPGPGDATTREGAVRAGNRLLTSSLALMRELAGRDLRARGLPGQEHAGLPHQREFIWGAQGMLVGAYFGERHQLLHDVLDTLTIHDWQGLDRDCKVIGHLAQEGMRWDDGDLPLQIAEFVTNVTNEATNNEEGGGGNLLTLRIASLARWRMEDAETRLRKKAEREP